MSSPGGLGVWIWRGGRHGGGAWNVIIDDHSEDGRPRKRDAALRFAERIGDQIASLLRARLSRTGERGLSPAERDEIAENDRESVYLRIQSGAHHDREEDLWVHARSGPESHSLGRALEAAMSSEGGRREVGMADVGLLRPELFAKKTAACLLDVDALGAESARFGDPRPDPQRPGRVVRALAGGVLAHLGVRDQRPNARPPSNGGAVASMRYGAAGLPNVPGSTERYGAVTPNSRIAAPARRTRTARGLDGPIRSVSAWESLIANAEAQCALGFFKHLTFKDRNDLDADRDFYEQANQLSTHDAHRTRLAAVLTAIVAWIADTSKSAIGQIADAAKRNHFLNEVDWSTQNFPGSGRPNTDEAEDLFRTMTGLVAERRVPMTVTYRDVDSEVVVVPDTNNKKLWPEAKEGFLNLRGGASGDSVALVITSAWRSASQQSQLAQANPNPNAVASKHSAHMYGLAVDLDLAGGNSLGIVNASTRSMTNMILMYRSPVYKWMFINADKFGWFPYRREPWHWEMNPTGLAARFTAAGSGSQGLGYAKGDPWSADLSRAASGSKNAILISGGPGLYNNKDLEHDKSWANYVTPPLLKTNKQLGVVGADVYWFVFKPAYVARWTDDADHGRTSVKKVKSDGYSSYVDKLEKKAAARGWQLVWVTSAADIWSRLKTFSDPIVRLWYWGHARNDLWLALDRSPSDVAVSPDASLILKKDDIAASVFKATLTGGGSPPKHQFIGCNTAKFAEKWATTFGVCAAGVDGKIDFGSINTDAAEPTLVGTAQLKIYCDGASSSTDWSTLAMLDQDGDDDGSQGEMLVASNDDEALPDDLGSGGGSAAAAYYGRRRAIALDAPLAFGVAGARITDPFYRDAAEKQALTGRSAGRPKHLGMDVSTSNASGGGATDARRGLPVYVSLRASIPIQDLNSARVATDGDGTRQTGLSIAGSGNATLVNALVRVQPWSAPENAYGGVIGLACRYGYTRSNGSQGTLTLYVEYLHLITDQFLPKDGSGRVMTASEWAATGKGIGFGPRMQEGVILTAADLGATSPCLVGYLGATEFPHVHIQLGYGDGQPRYVRFPRVDPTVIVS